MRRKLTLDVEALTVTSFETDASKAQAGTVEAREFGSSAETYVPCCPNPCNTRLTCSSNLC